MHEPNQFDLLKERRFGPFFWTQFFGAANDNVYKNALVIFVAFHAATLTDTRPRTRWSTSRGACSSRHSCSFRRRRGQLADKFEKSRLIRWIKLFEIAIMVVGLIGFWRRDLAILFTGLALMGVHSTLFGPVKYAILPQHLKPEELIGGNGLVEMGHVRRDPPRDDRRRARRRDRGHRASARRRGRGGVAVAGYLVSRAIPHTPAVDPGLAINWNPFSETWRNLPCRSGQPRRLAVDARDLVVLVLRRHLPCAVRRVFARHPRRQRARRHVPARALLDSESASARCCASGFPAAASSSAWFLSGRSG
jgi:hypothetical protein